MLDPRLVHAVAVARHGSFTAAATAVGITQSAITKSVADLERQVGYLIFHRTSRGVMPTEEGRDFTERAARLIDDAHDLLRSGGPRADRFAGALRIGVGPGSLDRLLAEPLERMLVQHPRLRVDVSGSTFERVIQQLVTGSIDVAIGYQAAFSGRRDVKHFELPSLRTRAFVRHGHPLAGTGKATLEQLAQFCFVMPSDSRPYSEAIRGLYESAGKDSRDQLHIVDSFELTKQIVKVTDSIGLSALPYIETDSFKRHYVAIGTPFDDQPMPPLCCAVRAHAEPKPAVRPLIAAIRDSLRVLNQRFPD
ncbi:LysR family transcriptional regulator [Zavarzinia sp. CC-PAN008]|uniref:LysR family transcriptional regulator n=1 Tax=Zavarzinia sp. CC-PAN008 TaxID=3243332 RepID=UPI003F74A1EC